MGIDEAVAIQGFMNRIQKATMGSWGMSCSRCLLPLCLSETQPAVGMSGGVVWRYGSEIPEKCAFLARAIAAQIL